MAEITHKTTWPEADHTLIEECLKGICEGCRSAGPFDLFSAASCPTGGPFNQHVTVYFCNWPFCSQICFMQRTIKCCNVIEDALSKHADVLRGY